jgi:hypothetical protein
MPHVLQQQAAPTTAAPSANDLASQIRAQVNQQLRAAGMSEQKAKSIADQAAQGASQNVTVTKDGKVIRVQTNPVAPLAPLAPLAPIAAQEPVVVESGTSVPPDTPLDIPPRLENLGYALFLMIAVIAVGKPLVRVFGNILERRALKPAMSPDFGARLERIEQGIESVSIEVERISESQRYLLKVQGATPERIAVPRSAS